MMIQYTIIATILAACILYAAFRIYKSLQQANRCKDGNYRCSGCAFYEQCKKKGKMDSEMNNFEKIEYFSKKDAERFGGFKKVVPLHSLIRNGNRKLYKVS